MCKCCELWHRASDGGVMIIDWSDCVRAEATNERVEFSVPAEYMTELFKNWFDERMSEHVGAWGHLVAGEHVVPDADLPHRLEHRYVWRFTVAP